MYKNESIKKSKGQSSETKKQKATIIERATRHLDLLHIPIKFHEEIYNGSGVMVRTRFFLQFSKGHNSKTKNGETIIFYTNFSHAII